MAIAKVVLDTNIVVDYLNEREPFYEKARLLKADAVVTRNQDDFPRGVVPIESCDEFFRRLELERDLIYDEVEN